MSYELDVLESLNPDPSHRGNPGPPAGLIMDERRPRRSLALAAAAILAVALVSTIAILRTDGNQPDTVETAEAPAVTVPSVSPVEPVSIELLAPKPALSTPGWELSPDGQWIAYTDPGGDLCLTSVAGGAGEPVCAETPARTVEMIWSPTSDAVLTLPGFVPDLNGIPTVVLGIDGTRTEILANEVEEDFYGAPFAATFIDADTIVYYTFLNTEPGTIRFSSIDLDGSNQSDVSDISLESEDYGQLGFDMYFEVVGSDVYIMATANGTDDGLYRIGLEDSSLEQVFGLPRGGAPGYLRPASQAGGVLLLFDQRQLGPDGATTKGELFYLLVDDLLVPVPELDGLIVTEVALSPDGGHIAVFEQSDADTRVSVATTESLLAERPEWLSLDIDDPGAQNLDLGTQELVWTMSDRLWIEASAGVYEVQLSEVG